MKNVMEARHLAKGSLEYFPTPPWATRALCHEILFRHFLSSFREKHVREPAAGGGHMTRPLQEFFGTVDVSDVADWGIAPEIRDFCEESPARLIEDGHAIPHWIITNPPYEIAATFLDRALAIATEGVAMFLRLGWIAGQERYRTIFSHRPPTYICPFAERVALIEGAWDPEASSATDYAWFVWIKGAFPAEARPFSIVRHLPPGMQNRYSRQDDLDIAMPGEAARRTKVRKAAAAEKAKAADLFGGGDG
ncbi:hypothetical protein AX761_21955 [Rhizobium sp. 58]|nr:hypothetical protein AX761_21955 [Rhizobium sp. 58]